MEKYAKRVDVRVFSMFGWDPSGIPDLKEYIKESLKTKGIVHELPLFDGSVVVIVKNKYPGEAYKVSDETEINILNKQRQKITYIL